MFGKELSLKAIYSYNDTCVASIRNCSVPYPSWLNQWRLHCAGLSQTHEPYLTVSRFCVKQSGGTLMFLAFAKGGDNKDIKIFRLDSRLRSSIFVRSDPVRGLCSYAFCAYCRIILSSCTSGDVNASLLREGEEQTQWMCFDTVKYVCEGGGVKGIIPWNIFKVILANFHSILYNK